MIGWFATLMSASILGCAILALAMSVSRYVSDDVNLGAGLAMIAAFTFMFPLGFAAAIAGGMGLFWRPPGGDTAVPATDAGVIPSRAHIWRCRSALAIGLAGIALGATLGVPFR